MAQFVHPANFLLAGPTSSGKTMWVYRFLKHRNELMDQAPQRIIYVYKRWQPLFTTMRNEVPGIEFVQGIPEELNDDSFLNSNVRNLIVLDDCMEYLGSNSSVDSLFT